VNELFSQMETVTAVAQVTTIDLSDLKLFRMKGLAKSDLSNGSACGAPPSQASKQ
jgi:hypothetical protein